MNPKLEALFDEPERAYLQTDELNALSQFVSSLPERITLYQRLRNEEVTLMQSVADACSSSFRANLKKNSSAASKMPF